MTSLPQDSPRGNVEAVREVRDPFRPRGGNGGGGGRDEDDDRAAESDWDDYAAHRACHDYDAEPECLPGLQTPAQWLAAQAAWYRRLGTVAADWLARKLDALANDADLVCARSFNDIDDRMAIIGEIQENRLRADGMILAGHAACEW